MQTQLQLLTSDEIETLVEKASRAEEEKERLQRENEQLRFRIICTQKDQNKIQAKGKSHIGKWAILAKESGLTVNLRRAVTRMWGEYKKHFGLSRSYRDTPEHRFEEALHWIDAWSLPTFLMEQPGHLLEKGESQ
ncbi:ORF6C domain-containing protein [Paenibacillus sp. S150]|uniref:ORF6C domain-containing protein n=1 Tax=Paenibacillus sp. S150 TaxID=2749826 RepID=UPI001C58DAC9|nr:ORF6C domain-containing protein [Paenibacillus sp. S150]MBW4083570.1 ORF6C domain-containing protein [Paenibacillus sp. S150]